MTTEFTSQQPAQRQEDVVISVDVVCPSRLARQGFAVASFPVRVPAVALSSWSALFSALKYGALVDEAEHHEFLQSVGAQDWILPQNGVIFAQERPLGPDGRRRWVALTYPEHFISSDILLVCGVREWRKIKSIEAKEEKADILHKRRLDEARSGCPPDRDRSNGGASKLAKAGTSSVSPSDVQESFQGEGGAAGFHHLPPAPAPPPPPASPNRSPTSSMLNSSPSLDQQSGQESVATVPMGLANGTMSNASMIETSSPPATATSTMAHNEGPCLQSLSSLPAIPMLSTLTQLPPAENGVPPEQAISMGQHMPVLGTGIVATPASGEETAMIPQAEHKKTGGCRKRMHKVHGPAFCKMFQMLRFRFIPQVK